MSAMKIKKGDNVQVIAGKDKGKEGKVIAVDTKNHRVLVEGVSMVTKHTKPSAANQQGGIVNKEAYIAISNVMLLHKGKITRVGFKMDGDKKVRYAKATGEVMGIGRTLEECLLKSIRSLEIGVCHLYMAKFDHTPSEELLEYISRSPDDRIYAIAQLIRNGVSLDDIFEATKITKYFLEVMKNIVDYETVLSQNVGNREILKTAKKTGFSDQIIAKLWNWKEVDVFQLRRDMQLFPVYKMIETSGCGGYIPYFYSTYGEGNESKISNKKKIIVLGSGPIRIGQGVEFDYSTVHAVTTIKEFGYESIIINNNPETVSTDYTTSDKLYFEPLTVEDVMNVVEIEQPIGVIASLGGQTAINLAEPLMERGVKIIGTDVAAIEKAENRDAFEHIMEKLDIPQPKGRAVTNIEDGVKAANEIGYPVLVRPSYVLGGQGMQIALSDQEIEEFMAVINRYEQEHPILVDKYLQGKELEVDAVCDGTDILIPGIMEHIERTGVHSGDSISVYPAPTVSEKVKETIAEYSRRLAKALHVIGLINIQFIAMDDEVYVIEVNPRSSRTVPYISKVTGIPIVDVASRVIMGNTIRGLGYEPGLAPDAGYVAIKMPVFSFEKLRGAEISLGPEMKSTGECLGIAETFNEALYKAFLGAGVTLPKYRQMIMTVKDADKPEAVGVAKRFEALGYTIYATRSTAKYLSEHGVSVRKVNKLSQESPNVMDLILGHRIDLVIDTPTQGNGDKNRDGFLIRRNAIETGVCCITAMDTANALALSLETALDTLTPVDIARVERRA